MVLAHIALIALISFIVAAITQRVVMASFAFKIGPISVTEIGTDQISLLVRTLGASLGPGG